MTERGSAAVQHFVEFWRELPLARAPYVHRKDADYVIAGPQGPFQLQLDVVPIPVNGCLRTADILLLMANPNFDAEQEATWARGYPDAARRLEEVRQRNLRQEHTSDDCPFYDLDPTLSSAPGAKYWRGGGKFRDAAQELQNVWGLSLSDAYRELSWRVAVLQMLPYRSRKFDHEAMAEDCESGKQARLLVQSLLGEPDLLIICPRRVAQWRLEFPSKRANVITYDPQKPFEAQKASLARTSRGGPSIIRRLSQSRPTHV